MEESKKSVLDSENPICYNNRTFIVQDNTENGEVDNQTVFSYYQNDNIVWADYSGGEVVKGTLIGTVLEGGELDFYYQHINNKHQVRVGKCHSIPIILANGKIELHEEWQWLNGDQSKGTSLLIER